MNLRPRRTAAAVLAVLASTALASYAAPAVALGATPRDAGAAGLERFYDQQLGWGSCAPFAGDDDERKLFAVPGLECASLTVPLDYAAPDGRTAQIAVLRHRTAQEKIGSLVVNPGGPGGSGIALAAQLGPGFSDTPFDLVGFDPRGVGASTPTIDCITDPEWDALRAATEFDASPAGTARAEDQSRQGAEQCVERSGGADVLANAGTRDVARDMDVLRAALGDRQLTYLGFSYGTRIGSTYAEMFPENVRAMVLDGAIDPTQTTAESRIAQMAAFQGAFETYAADCARSADCPLGTDPAQATAAFQALSRPLIDRPAPVRGDTRTLSYSDTVAAVVASLYSPTAWPRLTAGLAELRAGDGTILMGLADSYFGRSPGGAYSNDQEALLVVNCVDGDQITDRSVLADLRGALRRPWPGGARRAGRLRLPASDADRTPPAAGPGTAADAGHLDYWRPRDALPGRGRPGTGAGRATGDGRGHPAHGRVAGDRLRRQRRGELPRDPDAAHRGRPLHGPDPLVRTACPGPAAIRRGSGHDLVLGSLRSMTVAVLQPARVAAPSDGSSSRPSSGRSQNSARRGHRR
jgi:pimeloyl-ACP methyl ester carboxylesterase